MAADIVEYFFGQSWVVVDTPPILVTCDEPVIPVGGHGTKRDERGGLATAGVILHPLSPSRLLVMFHPAPRPQGPAVLGHVETLDVDREILAHATRWAFNQPRRKFTDKIPVPHLPAGSLLPEGPLPWDGDCDLYKYSKPTRWASCPEPPPWPVGPAEAHGAGDVWTASDRGAHQAELADRRKYRGTWFIPTTRDLTT